jgi:beta-phosphoglucomutase-like phosphatase (HAD superfamily)
MGQIKAILSDLDGVLVRAPEIHRIALNEALQEVANRSISKQEHDRDFNGLPTLTKLDMLVKSGRIKEGDIDRIYEVKQKKTFFVLSDQIKLDNAIINIGRYWKGCNFLVACVTNAIRDSARLMLELCGILPYIDIVISNQDVSAPKPDPAGYLKAMEALEVAPGQCIIIEDAPKGLAAARASGCPHIWQVGGVDDVHVKGFRQFMKLKGLL